MHVAKARISRASRIPTGIESLGVDQFEIGRIEVFMIVVDSRGIALKQTREMNSGTVQIGQTGR